MGIEISQEIQTRLAEEARRLGISEEALLTRLLGGHVEPASNQPRPELPRWNLGSVGALHRREIYDDAR